MEEGGTRSLRSEIFALLKRWIWKRSKYDKNAKYGGFLKN
jgi:hypothetical protein